MKTRRSSHSATRLRRIQRDVANCERCERLVCWTREVAVTKRAAFADEAYWGRAVPGFGDPAARVLFVGLAPAAHGANRTGRMFTGDRSGDWLFAALHRAGFANQAHAIHKKDGLELEGAYVTSVVHCAPPANRPTTAERDRCLPYLVEEISGLSNMRTIVALGSFGWDGALRALRELGHTARPKPKFGHLAEAEVGEYRLIGSYHPSQQNTFTGRLTRGMFDRVMRRAHAVAG